MKKEKKIIGALEPVNIDSTSKILEQLRKCICKIKLKGEYGTGFFCKILFGKETMKVLMTNYHVLKEKNLKENKKLNLLLNDEKEVLIINLEIERKSYSNKDYDVTLIELKEEDKIKDYLELDDNLFQDNAEIIYVDKSIYILHYPNGNEAKISYGRLNNINEGNIIHNCSIDNGSLGSPILNLQNNKVIGIHKECLIPFNYNMGTLLKLPLKDFIDKQLMKEREIITIKNKEYEIVKELVKNEYGKIYQVLKDNKYYAIKVIPIRDEIKNKIKSIEKKAEILSKFNCNNIVKYYDYSKDNNNIYILMEYCDGDN